SWSPLTPHASATPNSSSAWTLPSGWAIPKTSSRAGTLVEPTPVGLTTTGTPPTAPLRGSPAQAALGLRPPGPAAGAALARERARLAADGAVAPPEQGVGDDVVGLDVGGHVVVGPVGERVHLHQAPQ